MKTKELKKSPKAKNPKNPKIPLMELELSCLDEVNAGTGGLAEAEADAE